MIKVKKIVLIKWSYKSPLIMLAIESRMVIEFFEYVFMIILSFLVVVLGATPTPYPSNKVFD